MIHRAVRDDAINIINVMIDALLSGSALRGDTGTALRHLAGDLKANALDYIVAGTIGTNLQVYFDEAYTSGVTLSQLDTVREELVAEAPLYPLGVSLKSSGIVFSFVEQCKIIAAIKFSSGSDVDVMLARMNAVIEEIKLDVADLLFGVNYAAVVSLSASLIQHLVATERMLPRVVKYTMPDHLPSLYLANYLYADGSRSDELILENKVVHPAFMQREIVALSE